MASLGTFSFDLVRNATISFGEWYAVHDAINKNEPTIWNFFASPLFRILIVQVLIVNRCAAIVSPRNPQRTWNTYAASVILRTPLVIYGAWTGISLWNIIVNPEETHRTIEDVLFSLFLFQSCTYIVDVFLNCLELGPMLAQELHGDSPNLFEWAVTWHFNHYGRIGYRPGESPSPTPSTTDPTQSPDPILQAVNKTTTITPSQTIFGTHLPPILAIAALQCLQLWTLNVLALFGLQHLRLIPTTTFSFLSMAHFLWCFATNQASVYPVLQWMAKIPELSIMTIVVVVSTLHGAALLITGGAVRTRRIFNLSISLAEDFNLVLYKIGTACLEATQNMGLMRELDPIVIPSDMSAPVLDSNNMMNDVSGFAMNDSSRPLTTDDDDDLDMAGQYPRQRGILRLWVTFFKTVVYLIARAVKFVRNFRQAEAADGTSSQCNEVTRGAEWNELVEDPDYLPSESESSSDDDDENIEDGEIVEESGDAGTSIHNIAMTMPPENDEEEDLYREIFELANDLHQPMTPEPNNTSNNNINSSSSSLMSLIPWPLSSLVGSSPSSPNAISLLAHLMQEPPIMTRSARHRWEENAVGMLPSSPRLGGSSSSNRSSGATEWAALLDLVKARRDSGPGSSQQQQQSDAISQTFSTRLCVGIVLVVVVVSQGTPGSFSREGIIN
ncbi:hypothetical protein SmJEL517_g01376 [Synchytrium microbalum]|uniref:Transmembrane protein n=1 Tax=Synchytrium microbalum TaxID=1806994 RepID=A0A507CAP8_9FUNG|nr:uncharacterized protein SmJEL517_g01376 [Synchytrium microbalum]TPX36531.1 hypothetical protein SmJEL517_g01376 [Synchytrium microbalum]